jgi:hypothetical protein
MSPGIWVFKVLLSFPKPSKPGKFQKKSLTLTFYHSRSSRISQMRRSNKFIFYLTIRIPDSNRITGISELSAGKMA